MKYIYDGVSLQNGRSTNMDGLVVVSKKVGRCNLLLAVVCDGVGSMDAGAYATVYMTHLLEEWFLKLDTVDRIGLELRDRILAGNAGLLSVVSEGHIQTAATLSALLLADFQYSVIHCGDSRIYRIDADSVEQLTHDWVTDSGKLSSYIGQRNLFLEYSEGTALEETGFLLCSDGFYKHQGDLIYTHRYQLNSKKQIQKELLYMTDEAIHAGETDNITAALINIGK